MRPKWLTFLMAFGITFGSALVILLGGIYLGVYRPEWVTLEQAGLPTAHAADQEVMGPAPAAGEEVPPVEDAPEEMARPKTDQTPASSRTEVLPPEAPGKRSSKTSLSGARSNGPARPSTSGRRSGSTKGSVTRTVNGVFLTAPDRDRLDQLRTAATQLAPEGPDSGFKSLLLKDGVLTVTLTGADESPVQPDLDELESQLRKLFPGAGKTVREVRIIRGGEALKEFDLAD